jgi:hypothetical protein
MSIRGPKSEPKHGPTSFKWVVLGYRAVLGGLRPAL